MDERIAAAWTKLPDYLAQHILLSACSLALGVLISLPLAIAASRSPRLRWPVLAIASLIQTIPGLALLALFYPLLLAVSALSQRTLGYGFSAFGFLPSLLALTLYSMLPIIRNTVTGLASVDLDVREAALGVGMTARQSLLKVELPLAASVIMAGLRTASVWVIGAATLSTPVGQASLGNYIFTGPQTENWIFVLFGCVAAASLALVTDQLLGVIEGGLANAYALAMRRDLALALGIRTIEDLARQAVQLRIGGDYEFFARPEWEALRQAYGLELKSRTEYQSTFMYRAVAQSEVDVISAFSSDGRIAGSDLVVLEDNRSAIPPYDALLLIAPNRVGDAAFNNALRPLVGAIPVQAMRRANELVDQRGLTPRDAVRELKKMIGPTIATPRKSAPASGN